MSRRPILANVATLGGATDRAAALVTAHRDALPGDQLRDVAPDRLRPSPAQVRAPFPAETVTPLPEDTSPEAEAARALADLVASVRVHGVLEPVLARETPAGLELLAGHRRVEAARRAGLATVPVRILAPATDADAAAITATENLAREDLTAWETVRALATLRAAFRAAGRPDTGAAVARAAGRSEGAVSEALRVAALVADATAAGVSDAELQPLKGGAWRDFSAVLAHAKTAQDTAAKSGTAFDPARTLREAIAIRWRPAPTPGETPARRAEGSVAPRSAPAGAWTFRLPADDAGDPTPALRAPTGGGWHPLATLPADEAAAVLPLLEAAVKTLRARTKARPRTRMP